jgi:hypothetical protein
MMPPDVVDAGIQDIFHLPPSHLFQHCSTRDQRGNIIPFLAPVRCTGGTSIRPVYAGIQDIMPSVTCTASFSLLSLTYRYVHTPGLCWDPGHRAICYNTAVMQMYTKGKGPYSLVLCLNVTQVSWKLYETDGYVVVQYGYLSVFSIYSLVLSTLYFYCNKLLFWWASHYSVYLCIRVQ